MYEAIYNGIRIKAYRTKDKVTFKAKYGDDIVTKPVYMDGNGVQYVLANHMFHPLHLMVDRIIEYIEG